MHTIMNRPDVVFFLAFGILWLATQLGAFLHRRGRDLKDDDRDDFNVVLTATLTLLGLIMASASPWP